MSSGVRKPSLENKFLGSRGLSKGASGPEVSGGIGARAGLGPSGAFFYSCRGPGVLGGPRALVLRVGPGRGFPAAGPGAALEKLAMQREGKQ